jgi:hypothetical protein
MSILQATREGVVEHPTFPSEERDHRLNTVEAMRYIAALSSGRRKEFESQPNSEAQELMMMSDWVSTGEHEAIAGHHSSRALQLVRFLLTKTIDDTDYEDGQLIERVTNFYYPLMETPKRPYVANMHWDQESRFRRGIGHVLDGAVQFLGGNTTNHAIELPTLVRGESAERQREPYTFETAVYLGSITMENMVQTVDDSIIGSRYVITRKFNSTDQA